MHRISNRILNYWGSRNLMWYEWNLTTYDKNDIREIINIYNCDITKNGYIYNNQADLFIEGLDSHTCSSHVINFLYRESIGNLINDAIMLYKLNKLDDKSDDKLYKSDMEMSSNFLCSKCFDLKHIIKFNQNCHLISCIINAEKIKCPDCNFDDLILR
jgi:hypothetical protein